MNYLKDYEKIKIIIDEIIGIDTQQGNNLKMAIKKYFEMKPIDVKLVNTHNSISIDNTYRRPIQKDIEMDKALDRYTEKLRKNIDKIRAKGDYCGIQGWDT